MVRRSRKTPRDQEGEWERVQVPRSEDKIKISSTRWAAGLGWTHAPRRSARKMGGSGTDWWDGSLLLPWTSNAIASFVCLRQPIFVTTFHCKFMLFLLHGGVGRLATFEASMIFLVFFLKEDGASVSAYF